jgi:tetratricopeptide (TPR) repeat protein
MDSDPTWGDFWHHQTLREQERFDDHVKALTVAKENRAKCLPLEHPYQAFVRQDLADALTELERYEPALDELEGARDVLREQPLVPQAHTQRLYQQLARVCTELDQPDEAKQWREKEERQEILQRS